MSDKSAAWAYADPRYNAGLDYGPDQCDRTSWREWASWLDERIAEMERVCRGPVLVSVSVTGLLEFIRLRRRPTWVASWVKPWSSGHRAGGSFWLPHWEPIMQFGQAWGEGRRIPNYYLSDVFSCNPVPAKHSFHPCPKPEQLMGMIIGDIPGDPVLDPFCGSGTFSVMCERLGRQWAACELNSGFAKDAEKRIQRERDKLQLPFDGEGRL